MNLSFLFRCFVGMSCAIGPYGADSGEILGLSFIVFLVFIIGASV